MLNFNAQTVAPNSAFDPLQPGWYHVKIVDSEMKPVNPPKTGSYLSLTMEVIEGPAAGRNLFLNLNLENENPVAVRIAYEQLSALCYVTGRIRCDNSQDLHGIPFQAKVTIRSASGNYDASNDVKGFRNAQGMDPKDIATGGGVATAQGAPPVPGAPTAPSAAPSAAPAAPTAPAANALTPVHDPMAAATSDGWAPHPTDPAWMFKGSDVKMPADVLALYPAPVTSAAPAAPSAPTAPAAPSAAAAAAVPPWAK